MKVRDVEILFHPNSRILNPDRFNAENALRVGIISATFSPERSYQENIWAESLTEMGCCVRVFSPARSPSLLGEPSERIHTLETPTGLPFQWSEVPSYQFERNQVLTTHLGTGIVNFQPDLLIWFGCIMYFGREVYLDERVAKVPLITVYSLSRRGRQPFRWYGANLSLKERIKGFAFQIIKAPILTQTLKRAQLTIANTPECTDIIRQYVWGDERVRWARKHEEIPLGFCPHTFGFQRDVRFRARQALGLSEQETVIVFSSRFERDKWDCLVQCFTAVEKCFVQRKSRGNSLPKLVWIGAKDNELSERFRAMLSASDFSDNHHLISFQPRGRLATWYHTADILLFPQPSISVQEALGTGVKVLCPRDPSLDHLEAYSDTLSFAEMDDWPDHLNRMCSQRELMWDEEEYKRQQSAQRALALAYPTLIQSALDALIKRLSSEMSAQLCSRYPLKEIYVK